jgi:ubiquinone/menaquinone biosynthesis C-methylase UbiE
MPQATIWHGGYDMLMNKAEFLLMNNSLRALIQEKYEIPILLGMSSRRAYSNVLEIGCGNGIGTRLVKKYYDTENIVAIDLDEKMVALAQKSNTDPAINFLVMDASGLKFPDSFFDVVFDFGIIHHIPNWRECLRELRRVLKPDGELILEELALESFRGFPGSLWKKILDHPYKDMFTFGEFEKYLDEIGFEITNRKVSNPLGLLQHISLTARMKDIPETQHGTKT